MTNYEQLLRDALDQRRKIDPHGPVTADLNTTVAEVAQAVERVSEGRARAYLDELSAPPSKPPAFALVLRLNPDDDPEEWYARVFQLSESGYPLRVYSSRAQWDEGPTDEIRVVKDKQELEDYLRKFVSNPNSEFVRVLAHLMANRRDAVPAG